MKLYNLTDYDEVNTWHPTLRDAVAAYRDIDLSLYPEGRRMGPVVNEHTIDKPTKQVCCLLLAGEGFSINSRQVWPRQKGSKE